MTLYRRQWSRPSPRIRKAKWLSKEALQIAEKRREAKSKGEKERYSHLNAEFQRIARRDKKSLLNYQCKETEENNRMGKTRDLFKSCIGLAWVAQSCQTLCDPMACSLPGSSVHAILQARILEWAAISFSRGSSRPRDRTCVSRLVGRCLTVWATREVWKW